MLGIFILIYLVLNLGIGFWASRKVKTAKDFAVAGGSLPVWMCSTALFATWFGSETVLAASAEFKEKGLVGVIEEPFGAALCLLLVGFFFAKRFYKMNVLTFNDFFKKRFGAQAEWLSSLVMVPSYLGWVAAQLIALGILIHLVTGWNRDLCVIGSGLMVISYTFWGGMWAVTLTDFIQTISIILGLSAVAVVFSSQMGGWDKAFSSIPTEKLSFFPTRTGLLDYVAAWITVGLGSIPQQDVFQRLMTAKNKETASHSALWAGVMYLSIAIIPLYLVLCSQYLFPELVVNQAEDYLPMVILQKTPLPVQILFFGALIAAILSTCSGAMLAPSTVLVENIIKPRLAKKEMNNQRQLLWMRISVWLVGVSGLLMAFIGQNMYSLVSQSSAISLVTLFIPMMVGLFTKWRMEMGVFYGMIAGFVGWFVGEKLFPAIPSVFIGLLANGFVILIFIIAKSNLKRTSD